jgi:hypothetical protein
MPNRIRMMIAFHLFKSRGGHDVPARFGYIFGYSYYALINYLDAK